MKSLKIKLAAAALLVVAALSGPALAYQDPQMYCDCVHRCDKLYPNGGIPHATCLYNCEQAYGPALCKTVSLDPIVGDRR